MHVDALLQTVPPLVVYLIVGAVIGAESLGIPLPGEIILVSAALMASRDALDVSVVWVAVAGSLGAMVGDSTGYAVGRRFGMSLFEWLGGRFPRHFGTGHVALAERFFTRWGMWAVFVGRFVALLRIFAGPLAGALRMHYPRFLAANAAGAVCWAGGTTVVVYYLGMAAEKWLSRFSWVALVAALAIGVAVTVVVRRRTGGVIAELAAENDWESLRRAHRD